MGQRITNSIEAIFLASGVSPAIEELADVLTGSVSQNIAIGDEIPVTGETADQYSVIISILEHPASDVDGFRSIEKWIKDHFEQLRNLDADKTLEIHSYLDSETGCRIVTVPNSIIQLCGKSGLNVANQAIRVLSKSEYSRLRSTGSPND